MPSLRCISILLFAVLLGVLGGNSSLLAQGPPVRTPKFGMAVQDDYYVVLEGQVRFSSGSPAAGALVRLVSNEGQVVDEQHTDTSGHFSFTSLQRGDYTLLGSLDGYRTVSRFVSYSEASTSTIELTLVRNSSSAILKGPSADTMSVNDLEVPLKARKEYRRGLDSLSHGKTNQAQRHFENAIRIDPKFGESYEQLGLLYAEQGHYPIAETTLEKAVAFDNHDSAAYAYLGYVYQKAGNATKAGEQFRRSIQLNDANWLSQMGLGQVLLEKKQPAEALPHLRRAQQVRPQLPSIYLLVYNALIYLDRGPEALTELDKFLVRFPNDPAAPQLRKVRKGLAQAVREATRGAVHN